MRPSEILCVIVLYNISYKESQSYNCLSTTDTDIILIDNSDDGTAREYPENIPVVRFPSNPGLSHAYNRAANFAAENGYKWLMLADQDTFFEKDIISKYIFASHKYPEVKFFCPAVTTTDTHHLLSPVKQILYFSRPTRYKKFENILIDISSYAIINSGMLINLETFYKAGGYNENVSLDFSDFQFIERLSTISRNACVIDSEAQQDFSNDTQSSEQKLKRYSRFCISLKGYKCNSSLKKIFLNLLVIKRAVSLSLSTKTLLPFNLYLKKYLR